MKTITVPAALISEINATAIKLNKDELIINVQNFKIQWNPLNVNTLEPRVTDYIFRVIRLSKSTPCLPSLQNCRQGFAQLLHNKQIDNIISDHIKRLPLYLTF